MVTEKNIRKKFEDIGAKVIIEEDKSMFLSFRIDIINKKDKELFYIKINNPNIELQVLQTRKDINHLLLMAKNKEDNTHEKLLCGFDERHWFLVGVDSNVRNVDHAMFSLKPRFVDIQQKMKRVKPKNINKRHNKAFVRQGEWFFIPSRININTRNHFLYKNHSLGNGHICDEVCETRAETYFHLEHAPDGLLEGNYKRFLMKHPHIHPNKGWWTSTLTFDRYARGHVRHKDHKTIYLNRWHIVLENRQKDTPVNDFLD